MGQYDCRPYKKASEYRKHRPKDNHVKAKGEDSQDYYLSTLRQYNQITPKKVYNVN